jgi:hypothetical protein
MTIQLMTMIKTSDQEQLSMKAEAYSQQWMANIMKKKSNERQKTKRSSSDNETDDSSKATSFAQQKSVMICYCCGKEGHRSPECEQRSVIPRSAPMMG